METNTARWILVLTVVAVIGFVAWRIIAKVLSWFEVFHGYGP